MASLLALRLKFKNRRAAHHAAENRKRYLLDLQRVNSDLQVEAMSASKVLDDWRMIHSIKLRKVEWTEIRLFLLQEAINELPALPVVPASPSPTCLLSNPDKQ